MGFLLATTKELTNVSINSFENPIVSQDELLFNIIVEAFNPGWFTVSIDEVELDIFAKSGYLSESMFGFYRFWFGGVREYKYCRDCIIGNGY